MKLLIAINNGNFIGKDNDLMWCCREDLKHFKALTLNTNCLVGRKTFDSLPPLKNRKLIVVGKEYNTLEEALALQPDWVIGGGEIYKQTVLLCDELHISVIDNDDVGDTSFELPDNYIGKIFYYYFSEDKSNG